jgi:hypothetical protein
MEPNDQEVNWKEVASLLNGANEVLVEKIHKLTQNYTKLQEQYEKMQSPALLVKKSLNQNN